MKKLFLFALLLCLSTTLWAKGPKYVFYFIGDGMGANHVALTQGAMAARGDSVGFAQLSFTTFPVKGVATTHSATRLITDSAAAGTALASGEKTSPGTIGMTTNHSTPIESMAIKAHKAGRSVGILTTVSIDHATPAAFYAHEKSRSMYTQIANWSINSGIDILAGSGFLEPSAHLFDSLKAANYSIVYGSRASLSGEKVVWMEDTSLPVDALRYAIDRKGGEMTLPAMVDKSIQFLMSKNSKQGFFMMAEGGKIDWAAHSNDAATIVHEVMDLSDAVAVAVAFYKAHPKQTLIVVTADHETGGLSLGRREGNYDSDLGALFTQVASDSLKQQTNLKARAAFTSGAHTAALVPIFALGQGAELFDGTMDNTEIAKKLINLMK
ncbi:MAG: alkaline phosphatase [Mucinivorans sp.]